MILAAVSDVVWQALIAAVVTVVLSWRQERIKSAVDGTKSAVDGTKTAVEAADKKTNRVARKLEVSDQRQRKRASRIEKAVKKTQETGEATHALCNSAMGEQKRMLAVALRVTADLTKTPHDIALAEHAEAIYAAHTAHQIRTEAVQAAGSVLKAVVSEEKKKEPEP